MSDQNCYLVLMRAKLKAEALQNIDNICSTLRAAKQDAFQKIVLTCNTQTLDFYGYFYLKTPAAIDPIEAQVFLGDSAISFSEVEIGRLVIKDDIKGVSDGVAPGNRYVVEMDPETGWQDELFSWYDQEHLPGLASVPGCIAAFRFINLDYSPHSFACYDLINPEVLGCEPWLKVRNTSWSDRVRPHFTNVKRTMFNLF